MILCLFCDEPATFAYETTGIVWTPYAQRVHFCRAHLLRYYLSLDYMGAAS